VVILLAGCPGSAGPAAKIQPPPPTVAAAEHGGKAPAIQPCSTPARADLMVVDWTPEARGDLEVAMKEGLALLAYDCKSAQLVPACMLAGNYAYIGTTKREKKIEMSTSDEIAANLPVSGISWLTEIGGKFGRETGLLAQMVMIGKRSSAKKVVVRSELEGACTEATHYVRAATIGAFAVASGSKAELGGQATVMGKGGSGSSKSSTKIESQDGDMAACDASTPDAKQPPAQCGAIVRIELEPIGASPAAAPELAVATCAPGFVPSDGACVKPDRPHQCSPDDAAACRTQCAAGNAGSCATAAALDKDLALASKACAAAVPLGCRVQAALTKAPKEKIELLERACAAGDGVGCVDLGIAKLADKKLAGDAQYAFRRACYGGGEIEGCTMLGMLYVEGKGGMSKNPKLAAEFLSKACKEGSQKGCDGLKKLAK
jgi:hypothetical protein